MPDGPAAQAGIAANDIITHIGGQAIQSPDELTRNVASHQPGEKIRVAIIRKGKSQDLDVTLGQRPNNFAEATPEPRDAKPDLNAIPNELRERARQMLGENFGEREMNFEQQLQGMFPEMNDAMKQLRQHMENAMRNLEAPKISRERGIQLQQGTTFRLSDEKGCVEVQTNNGSKEVTVRDADQKIAWSGPWDTAQDKAAAPEDVRQRIEALNIDSCFRSNGFSLRFGNIPDNK
jgi:C-terminal processing protease CtpA/Prc